MSTSQQSSQPSAFGGVRRIPHESGGTVEDDLFIDKEFATMCPPDIQSNTRVVALCGAHNFRGNAAPSKDGWFFSDFYLFHHLLEDNPNVFQSGNQVWLTCVDPETMVAEHQKYYHGPPNSNRRVVLDAEIAKRIKASKNLRVIEPQYLLERFLATLKDEARIAAEKSQPVLVLIFGHGEKSSHGIFTGRHTGPSTNLARIPRLTIHDFHCALRKDVDVTLMITSCYSGGWIIQPRFADSSSIFGLSKKRPLNITAMTGAGVWNESRSWALRNSLKASGGMFASSVLNALLTVSERTPRDERLEYSLLEPIAKGETGEPITLSPTYIELAESVHAAIKAADPSFWDSHHLRFSAQDDKWATEWRPRTGFPLTNYKSRWEQLEIAPQSSAITTGQYLLGSLRRDNIWEDYGNDPDFFGTVRAKAQIVQAKALSYMLSNPGDDTLGGNVVHRDFERLIREDRMDKYELSDLSDVLDYRLGQIAIATQYAEYLGLSITECRCYNTQTWINERCLEIQSNDPVRSSKAKDAWNRYNQILPMIIQKQIFNPPQTNQGYDYSKPEQYLAIAFVQEDLDRNTVKQMIDCLSSCKKSTQCQIADTEMAKKIRNDSKVKDLTNRLLNTVSRLKQRVRSISPGKKGHEN